MHLRDDEPFSDSGAVVRHSSAEMPDPSDRLAWLQLRGEVARGGMGVIIKGRDNDLGRDLAVKVLLQAGLEGVRSDDYVIWCDRRIMAVIHQTMDGNEQKLFLFNEARNDPIAGREIAPMPNWPTYEEWVESGRKDLWKTVRYP